MPSHEVRPSKKLTSRFVIIIFAVTFILRLGPAWYVGYFHKVDRGAEMLRIAAAVASHRSYSDP